MCGDHTLCAPLLNAFIDCILYVNAMTNWHCNAFSNVYISKLFNIKT